jgi:hypothetical protein
MAGQKSGHPPTLKLAGKTLYAGGEGCEQFREK